MHMNNEQYCVLCRITLHLTLVVWVVDIYDGYPEGPTVYQFIQSLDLRPSKFCSCFKLRLSDLTMFQSFIHCPLILSQQPALKDIIKNISWKPILYLRENISVPFIAGHGRNFSVFSIRKNFPLKPVAGVLLFMDTVLPSTSHTSLFIRPLGAQYQIRGLSLTIAEGFNGILHSNLFPPYSPSSLILFSFDPNFLSICFFFSHTATFYPKKTRLGHK